ncbi:MAG: ParB/RepB/Spo0J family partition protein [Chloroflexi bacterium]|nr:MAG: ParB/RepB/Spo0J family partition protein [Chloroflexota bacterium]
MAKQKFGLGRGLDALISGASEVMAAQQPSRVDEESIFQIPIDSIIPNPRQPRRAFREDDPKLLELSASIKQYGLLQPLVVTRLDSSAAPKAAPGGWFSDDEPAAGPAAPAITAVVQYQIIAGERRWRAARVAGLKKIPVVVKEATPQEMLELALIENIQRADLNPIEEALAYQALIEEYGLTQEMVARQVSKDRSTITKLSPMPCACCNSPPGCARRWSINWKISPRVTRAHWSVSPAKKISLLRWARLSA